MGGLDHNFILVYTDSFELLKDFHYSTEQRQQDNYKIFESIKIHDDIISYFWDYLCWIPSRTTWDDGKYTGLNRWGITIYDKNSQQSLKTFLTSLRNIFSLAPEQFSIRGPAFTEETIDPEERNIDYISISLVKEEFMKKLDFLDYAVSKLSETGYYLLHTGI